VKPPVVEDWRAQLRDAVTTLAELERVLVLTADERAAFPVEGLPLGITPHFLSLMDVNDVNDPLRAQVVPRSFEASTWDLRDPLGEEEREAVPFLVHRYPDRVLLLATDRCASYCRFCTRQRFVGQGPGPTTSQLDEAIAYVAARPAIREVILSGGDALVLSDDKLMTLLHKLARIPHLDVVRLATRMLAFAPTRVTDALVDGLCDVGDTAVYVLTHFNHPRELAPDARTAIRRLVDGGVPVLNQTVLLRGVNDRRDVLTELFRSLTKLRARPYYLHQCDLAPGTAAFRVPLEEARALYASLRGHLSGLSIPTLVVDLPGGLGKQPLSADPVVETHEDHVVLRGYRGDTAKYPRR
jgi:lysine 2,3-aminomutase